MKRQLLKSAEVKCSSVRDICVKLWEAQGTSQNRGQKDELEGGEGYMKRCVLDKTWFLHELMAAATFLNYTKSSRPSF